MSKKALKISQKKNVVRFFLFLCMGLILAMVIMVFSSNLSAAEDDLSYLEKAREKKYLGGADEGDLKVLVAMPAFKNKKIKTEEADEGF